LPFISAFTLGVITLLSIIIARDFGNLRVGKTFVGLLLMTALFLIESVLTGVWRDIAGSITTTVPALFWLLCQLAFAYRAKIVTITGGVALYSFTAPAINKIFGISIIQDPSLHYITWTLATYTEYLLIGLGLWSVISHWKDDLVESSRHLRTVVLVCVGISILLVVVPMNTGLLNLDISYLAILTSILVCAYFLIEGKRGVLYGVQQSFSDIQFKPRGHMSLLVKQTLQVPDAKSNVTPIANPEVNQDELKLAQLMKEGFYRTEHLTIKTLAQALQLPEYKTRTLINQTLGYRNFNDFINQLRIQEAAQRLSHEPDTPILNISLDVGYRTLSSFNRAFKDIKNTTPTEHRQLGQ
jgi:AraC-like DNA-binding protein